MRRQWWLIVVLMLAAGMSRAQGISLEKNQLVAFLGDSITQQNLYTRYVELLLNARYPDLKLRFVNAGWSGRHAGHLLDESVLERDLLRLKPDVVLVMFGMNDGWYRAPADPAVTALFQENLEMLLMNLRVELPDARIVLLTPPPCEPSRAGYLNGYNDTLAAISRVVATLAARWRLPYIDLFSPLLQVYGSASVLASLEGKPMAPKMPLTLDGVHPTPVGHWLIADVITRAFGVLPVDVRVEIDARELELRAQQQTTVRNLRERDGAITFTQALPAIPVAIPLEARPALEFAPARATADRALLVMHGLAPDILYGVYADEWLVGHFTGHELDAGIDWMSARRDNPLTARVLDLAMDKFNYRWTAWRAPSLGTAAVDPNDDKEDRAALAEALSRLTKDAEQKESAAIEDARALNWRIIPEMPAPLLKWEVTGPLNYRGFDYRYLPEANADQVFQQTVSVDAAGFLSYAREFNNFRNSVMFARAFIYVPRPSRLTLTAGSFGGIKILVNGKPCIACDISIDFPRAAEPGQDVGFAYLDAGWNAILVRETRGVKGWGFYTQAFVSGLNADEMLQVRSMPQ